MVAVALPALLPAYSGLLVLVGLVALLSANAALDRVTKSRRKA